MVLWVARAPEAVKQTALGRPRLSLLLHTLSLPSANGWMSLVRLVMDVSIVPQLLILCFSSCVQEAMPPSDAMDYGFLLHLACSCRVTVLHVVSLQTRLGFKPLLQLDCSSETEKVVNKAEKMADIREASRDEPEFLFKHESWLCPLTQDL